MNMRQKNDIKYEKRSDEQPKAKNDMRSAPYIWMIVVGLEDVVENSKDKSLYRICSCLRKCSIWIRIHFSEVSQRIQFNI